MRLFSGFQTRAMRNAMTPFWSMLGDTTPDIDQAQIAAFVREGYQSNPVVYRVVTDIARAVAECPIYAEVGGLTAEDRRPHAVDALIESANLDQSLADLAQQLAVDLQLTGEAVAYGSTFDRPAAVWPVAPGRLSKVEAARYVLDEGRPSRAVYPIERAPGPRDGYSQLLFVKLYNPANPVRGLSPLSAAAVAGNVHNIAMRWNYSLLQRGARPSAVVQFQDTPDQRTLDRVREWWRRMIQGADNAGEMAFLPNGATISPLSSSPAEMEFSAVVNESAAQIAQALGYPRVLLLADAATYSNMHEAKTELYTSTVLPLARKIMGAMSRWLSAAYRETINLRIDEDKIPSLAPVRRQQVDSVAAQLGAGIITPREARDALGWPEIDAPGVDALGGAAAGGLSDVDFSASEEERAVLAGLAYGGNIHALHRAG